MIRERDTTVAPAPSLSKDALIVFHRDLHRLRVQLERRGIAPADAFREYDEAGITAKRVDVAKRLHLEAIHRLMRGIGACLERDHA